MIAGAGFATLAQIRDAVAIEAANGDFGTPQSVLDGRDIACVMTEMSGVRVEFRRCESNDSPHCVVTVFAGQQAAIVQGLMCKGAFFALAFATLLVGHGFPATCGDRDTYHRDGRCDGDFCNFGRRDWRTEKAFPSYCDDTALQIGTRCRMSDRQHPAICFARYALAV